jgi:Protein of unknown function (DUF3306)
VSDPENFLARWSRRKRAAAEDAQAQEPAATPDAPARDAPPAADARTTDEGAGLQAPEPGVDLAKLPPLESITAETDIRAYLAPGVPAELTRAALRRVWSADPQIRDFVGLSENSWDFNDPDAVAGFGRLEITDELRRQIEQMIGGSPSDQAEERPAQAAGGAREAQASLETTGESAAAIPAAPPPQVSDDRAISPDEPVGPDAEPPKPAVAVQRSKNDTAAQEDARKPAGVKRSHGRALPED